MGSNGTKPRRTLRGIIWRFLASLVLIPLVAAMVVTFPAFMKLEIGALWWKGGPRAVATAFLAGTAVYILLHIFLHRPITAYVFAHELTHALWARLTGHKVKKIKVGKGSGQTITEGSNWLVRLAPYCFPLYTLLLIGAWFGLQYCYPPMNRYHVVLFAGIGFSYAFHVLLTLHFLKVGQSDLHAEGYCFSLSLILAVNIELGAAVYAAISYKATWWRFQVMVWECLCVWGGKLLAMIG